jgi:hypothetical protein
MCILYVAVIEVFGQAFDPGLVPSLIATLRFALEVEGCKLGLIALTVRKQATMELFLQTASSK